jgi:glycine cleavage system H protein
VRLGGCEYEDSLLYDSESGTWGREEGGSWRLGITPLVSWLSGGFTSISLKAVGTKAAEGSVLGSVEGPKHFDVVRAPFGCVVRKTNDRLLREPRVANKDPFGEGWLALLEKTGGRSRLIPLARAAPSIEEKLSSMHVHCFAEFPDVEMYEIGTECSAVLARLNELIERSTPGTVVHVVSDDPTADIEMERWKDQTGNPLIQVLPEGALHHFIVKKKE